MFVCMQKEKTLLLQPKEKKLFFFSWKKKREGKHAWCMCDVLFISCVGTITIHKISNNIAAIVVIVVVVFRILL